MGGLLLRLGVVAALLLTAVSCNRRPAADDSLVIGFSQIGSESGWRAAETAVARREAERRGIDLRISDGQQRQENQIRAIRAFIAQGVDAILLAPVVETGWDNVLAEARAANIPVVLLDRRIATDDQTLYLSAVTSDLVREGRVAGEWLASQVAGRPCNVVELQGTVGASPTIDRKRGFEEAIADAPNIRITQSQTGEFTRAKGKEVMEAFLRGGAGRAICAVYAHNDDMMIGAIQAMKEAGLRPGRDILTVSIDAVPDIFQAMAQGDANATVELTPNMAGPAFDLLDAYRRTRQSPPKWVQTPSTLFLPDTAAAEYERRRDLY
jgi:simple sugar transport system substrate-binding protein